MKVVAGDIGGTKTLLRLVETGSGQASELEVLEERRYASGDYETFAPLMRDFLSEHGQDVTGACLAVAGPVDGRRARTTNLPWELDADELERSLGLPRTSLINDFQAVGEGLEALAPEDLLTLQAGEPRAQDTRAVIGAGTGLGEGLLVWRGKEGQGRYEALATEGGHSGFSPTDEIQIALLRWLQARHDHVSNELVLSGPGLVNIYRFLHEYEEGPADILARVLAEDDPAATISGLALGEAEPVATRALDLFCRIYGARAGDLALTGLARGGVFVAGGIAPQILTKLRDGQFVEAFCHKGKMAELMRTIPIHVVLNADVGVMGAAVVAAREAD
ncbi:MAG TPA: glucokinase [Gammaproteobacteria bacterium]|nr:glucokinase [Gammaproteobacteria bacterium]